MDKLAKKVFGTSMLLALSLLAVIVYCNPAKADEGYYATIGIGSSEHHYRHDGFWVQQNVPHEEDDTQNMWSLGIGKQLSPWLSAELTYYDLGQWSNFIKFCSDANYDKDACRSMNTDGTWTAYGYGRGESHALAVSLLPTYRNGKFAAFVRGGLTYYWTKYEVTVSANGDPIHTQFATYGNPTMVRGVGYVAGYGLEYNGLRVEYLLFPDISGSDTAHDKVTALTVSALWKF